MSLIKFKNYLFNTLKDNYILFLILFSAFLVRVYGIYFDYPGGINHIWDENYNLMQIFDIIESHNLFSSTSSPYPALLTILYVPILVLRVLYLMIVNHIYSISNFKDFIIQGGMGYIYIVVRWYSVFFGTAAVYLLYKIFNYIYDKKTGYIAALTYSFCIIPVYLSHWGKAHSVMIFFFLLSLLFSLYFEKEKKIKYFYLSSLFAGCAISVHYIGISALIFPLLNFIFNYRLIGAKNTFKSIFIGVFTILFFYGANYNGVISMINYVNVNYYEGTNYSGLTNVSVLERFTYIFVDSWRIEPFLTVLALLTIFLGCRILWKNILSRYLLLGIIFNYFLMVTIIVGPDNVRWLLIFMSLSYPLAIVFVYHILKLKNYSKISYIACLLLILPSLLYCIKWDMVTSKNTSVQAANWAKENLKNSEWLYTFYSYIDMPFSYDSALWNKENNKFAHKKIDYIVSHKDDFIDKGYNIAFDNQNQRFELLAGKNTRYILLSFASLDEKNQQLNNIEKYHKISLAKSFEPVNKNYKKSIGDIINNPKNYFDIINYTSGGHFINIYKIINK